MAKRLNLVPYILSAFIAVFLAGCSALSGTMIGSGQSDRSQPPLELSAGENLGQTFTTRQNGLAGVEVYLSPRVPGSGKILLKLFKTPQDTEPLVESSLLISSVTFPGWYEIPFPARPEANPADFFFALQIEGTGQVAVAGSAGASYLEGSAYQNGQPLQDAQLTFQLVYDRQMLILGLIGQGLQWLAWLALTGLLFVLPGWVLLGGLWADWQAFFVGQKLGLAIGVSLALYPVLFLWTYLAGLRLGVFYAILPAGIALVFLLNRLVLRFRKDRSFSFSFPRPQFNLADLAYVLIVGLIFAVRFYIARPLYLPLWGDSYQHTVITQLLMDNKGLFQSWQPYADMVGMTYHFGFHSLAAVFGWAAGLDAPQAVIWFGQILNGLAILALYPLAVHLYRNRWAGVVAILVGGLLVQMPMFYINWGRYTQLAGQAILPVVMILVWSAMSGGEKKRKTILLTGLAVGGLALTHYRVLILAVLFFPLVLLFDNKVRWSTRILKMFQVGLIGGLIFLPWFINVFAGGILANTAQQLTTPASAISDFLGQYNSAGSLSFFLPIWIWLLFVAALTWGLWRHERKALFLTCWLALVILATNPAWLNLPGTGVISNFAILIAAYIPAAVFIGAAGGWLMDWISYNRRIVSIILIIGVVGLGLWGAKQRLGDVQFAQSTLAARPDLRASAWIRANLPLDASFLVNSFPAYGGSVMAGSDGGWWLRFLSGRQTSLPPLLYGEEPGPDPNFAQSINDLTNLLYRVGINSPEMQAELARRGIDYIYVGQIQGRGGYGGPYPLEPVLLLTSQYYHPIYHQDRVWIFKANP
jgi:hypothetical protein